MKNMKKLLQKAMVFTLTAAMLVGTPMTASAAGLVDLYSISDGTGTVDDGTNPSTGTITNTDTNTGFLIENNKVKIVGIALDRQTVKAEVGVKEILKATVVLDGRIRAAEDISDANGPVCEKDEDITDKVIAEMSKKIEWKVLYTDADGKVLADKPNPAEKVGLELTAGNASDRSVVTLTPHQGTKDGEEVTVRASIDASYYFNAGSVAEQSNSNWEKRLQNDKKADKDRDAFYMADAKVSVKEYSTELKWSDTNKSSNDTADTLPLKHTLDLGAKLMRVPETANDSITWTSSNASKVAVSATGVVTAKKTVTNPVTITAVSERGKVATRTILSVTGTKANGVEITESWSGNDLEIADGTTKTIKAVTFAKINVAKDAEGNPMIADTGDALTGKTKGTATQRNAKVMNGQYYVAPGSDEIQQLNITDVITWSSNKPAFAEVAATGSQIGGGTATVTLKSVGKATITAKATNGAKASKIANVKASLQTLSIGGIDPNQTYYSGQTIDLTAIRTPAQNKDAVKWSIKKVSYMQGTKQKEKTNPNATISQKGVLTISKKVDTTTGYDIVIHLETSKAVKKNASGGNEKVVATDVTIPVSKIKQASIDTITVTEKGSKDPVAYGGYGSDNKNIKGKAVISKTVDINIPLSKTFVANVSSGNNDYTADASNLTWKTNKPKVAAITGSGANATIKAVGTGTAKITVSGVRVNPETSKASLISVNFNVKVKQPVTTLTMNKPTVTLAQKTHATKGIQNQNVTLQVTFGPKKADKDQTKLESWTVENLKTGEKKTVTKVVRREEVNVTSAKMTCTLERPEAGDVYKITAKSVTGVTATSTITIVAPTTEVAIVKSVTASSNGDVSSYDRFTTQKQQGKNTVDVPNTAKLTIGEGSIQMKPIINIGKKETKNQPGTWVVAGEKNTEQVTYTVSKKGIVTIDSEGRVYPVKKGTVTITAKTPTNKKATLKVTVE